ncbi:ubiquinone biosynthesis protein [Saccharopolyspora antimicrobica]|uniref:Ubiquinone biosynthesis protein n=1 Tax=Saccharopolyspora antimicrobica TaxID=455193 RepID=A0A1I4VS06_9PSEU|nr:AarF/UbiB family protein [Saccharopolyspora antimicrobica]RKT87232.1 ubiquinone biosynthesis protein [Saccharopolyspora antimicrobica]SFN04068.1 ubiquinone biosynthesis protein [Saccharopolyspora antimicrobica]
MSENTSRLVRLPGLVLRCGRVGAVVGFYGLVIAGSAVRARLRRSKDGRGLRDGDRWVRLLTRLGPSYIKIGQLLSTRRDLLPEAVTTPLARLTDAARPPARWRIERTVRRAYRDRPWPFRSFEWHPVACGSIATVHEAVTLDGRRVAVKVRRPGIERVMRQDFALTAFAMSVLGMLPKLRKMPFKLMHEQVGGAILRQLDFPAEAAALTTLRSNLSALDDLRIPAALEQLCTAETVVMEYVSDLKRFEPGDLDVPTRRAVVRAVLAAIYEMLFVDGVVHCDLHPGNLYFDRGANLVMLDAGFVVQLPDPVRRSFADFFINMAMGDGRMCAQIVIDSAAQLAEDSDLERFRTGLKDLVERASGARSGEFDLAHFAGGLFDLQRRCGLFPAPEFAFPLLSLLVIEGMIKGFDADVDFQAEALPVLRRRNIPRDVPSAVERRGSTG